MRTPEGPGHADSAEKSHGPYKGAWGVGAALLIAATLWIFGGDDVAPEAAVNPLAGYNATEVCAILGDVDGVIELRDNTSSPISPTCVIVATGDPGSTVPEDRNACLADQTLSDGRTPASACYATSRDDDAVITAILLDDACMADGAIWTACIFAHPVPEPAPGPCDNATCAVEACDDQGSRRVIDGRCCACPPEGWYDVLPHATTLPGFVTIRLTYRLQADQHSIYRISGTPEVPLSFPPAYHAHPIVGANIGGVSPVFFTVISDFYGYPERDSWLTIGVVDASSAQANFVMMNFSLSAVPNPFALWDEDTPLASESFTLTVYEPPHRPEYSSTAPIVIAQLTYNASDPHTGPSGSASALLSGETTEGGMWSHAAHWSWVHPG